ncbi:UNVERIFIED_CONTAM: isochorismatase family protein [Streptococcus canis]|uniref:Uncharacterized protein n=1 Tax=Streptococcus canis FSL Z3-227 TaxID=482234 RepID=A0AAV3FPU5_STRCB|nr:hypothetical protein SCAZ3_02085 [Streptococcus canis FSL Z3-227]MDV5987661.1 isochorismatase family protein [Streptococcus canis]MDV6001282.1 isochorismatase family protein [Streptococcus canis]QJD11704.1 isochorismatase family protein [Streptococcus canis]
MLFGSSGWEIDESAAPQESEKIFDKSYNSAFKETGLVDY